ncbi:ShlB/FhaC/HecB family hemolysin secretion/activation protein [Yersinia enterocolitica]|uniref:ShlB/FhaC/HecB family hemolysin secretion/activation protein n=1 Tax=Yersinia enterocolitica TaxID=630 RepID=UPI0002819ACF|nr:putative hemolysin activator protein [Yersinia enterocolitica subsp. enterocolitica WA-314]PNM15840.1 hemolysin activation protein [Yersinia enterocolitica]PNM18388.1 hemolysin activation protein [Yersinia enterocolitica]HDL7732735.1 ShlB/FhaC/HecB family hemolysin secretion/activation protein [Yersinia enterocolitica]HDL8470355.1 ShlB/FhaC/HecB family hemolysin secretion/activation protein [Yersinia enterocolitica]
MNLMIKCKYIIILLFSNVVWATQPDESKRPLSNGTTQQSDISEYHQQFYKSDKYFFRLMAKETDDRDFPEKNCLPITAIFLQGHTLLTTRELDKLNDLINYCISSNDLNTLAKKITRLYLDKGYLAARVSFIPLNTAGQLGINITEGIVEKIEGGDRQANPYFLFPNMLDKPLNISELDQGIDQANRLRSNKVRVDVLPGTLTGMSTIRINNNNNAKPWSLWASIDNYGYKNSDEWQAKTVLTLDSPLGISDLVNINFNKTLENGKRRYKHSAGIYYSVPYGALTLSALAHHTEYRRYEKLTYRVVNFNGYSQQYNFRADYTFHRNQKTINSISGQLEHKQINNYVYDTKININSHRLSAIELAINQYRVIPNGSMNVNVKVKRGLPWFAADKINASKRIHYADGQFTTANAMVNFNRNFVLFNSVYQFNHVFVGQYSKNKSPGAEWINLTERNAIRGFSRSSQSANNGWYVKNTLSRDLSVDNVLLTPRVGIDAGQVLKHENKQGWQSNSGISTGITVRYQKILFDLEASRGWWISDSNKQNEPIQLLGRISYTF